MIAIIKRETSKSNVNIIDDIDLDNFIITVEEPVNELSQNIGEFIEEPVKEVVESVEEPVKEVIANTPKIDKTLSVEEIKKQIQDKILNFNKKI